jgi:hypothetical protein
MSYPNDTPAAAWYPDPKTPGQVRWWDGANWTEHVSVLVEPIRATALYAVPQLTETTASPATATHATVTPATAPEQVAYGRHAAGTQPAPREAATVPQIRPRVRAEVPVELLSFA